MTNTGDGTAARRRTRGLTVVAITLLLAAVAAAFAVGALIDDGDVASSGPLAWLLVISAPAMVGAAVALLVTRWRRSDPTRSVGSVPGSLRQVKAALRDGRTTDPRIDALARKEAERQVSQRWVSWIYGAALAAQVLLVVGTDRTSTRWVSGLGVLAWATALGLHWVAIRRARRYLSQPAPDQAGR
ncbi:hypothetical protein O7634_15950 [Micromonospora sp. WMMD1120]|uniref:hypothetical protein n=1 Tax=Micromonospora sp. WMMD1120 TaxID=3016106 RepID=UPI002417FF36|nr:hypothetical protein [Micromonospora sp. WMMD1120]MDG4808246.1 hypothetical protein [Micromonospora sp. WMMD1120]